MSSRQIQNETGLASDQIDEQIHYFSQMGKILYDPNTHEFLIVNWMRHNVPINPSVAQCVKRELDQVKSVNLKDVWNHLFTHKGMMPTSCLHHGDIMPSLCEGVSSENLDLNDNYKKHQEQQELKEKQETEQKQPEALVGVCSLGLKEFITNDPSLLPYKTLEQEQPTEQNNTTHPATNTEAAKPAKLAASTEEGAGNHSLPSFLTGIPATGQPKEAKAIEPEPKLPGKPESSPPTGSASPPPGRNDLLVRVQSSSDVLTVLQYFNKALCTGYRYDSPVTHALIQKQLNRGFTVADCLKVIDKKKKDWGGNKFKCNLTPMILFSDKFESYLQQSPRTDSIYQHERPPVSVYTNKTLVEV